MEYKTLFNGGKPVFGMIHTMGTDSKGMLELAKKEIEIYLRYGICPLIENYFGSSSDCEEVLKWILEKHPDSIYGVNILGDYPGAFRMARQYRAKFIQIDSVCGHLLPVQDQKYAEALAKCRKEADVVLLGGVRFKYQPVLSGRSLAEDLNLAMDRCDAIVCTGEGTGMATPMEKVSEFKSVVGDFPVLVGAGVTLETAAETFSKGDGAIVGSWFKEHHDAAWPVNEDYVKTFMAKL